MEGGLWGFLCVLVASVPPRGISIDQSPKDIFIVQVYSKEVSRQLSQASGLVSAGLVCVVPCRTVTSMSRRCECRIVKRVAGRGHVVTRSLVMRVGTALQGEDHE